MPCKFDSPVLEHLYKIIFIFYKFIIAQISYEQIKKKHEYVFFLIGGSKDVSLLKILADGESFSLSDMVRKIETRILAKKDNS
jgi:hypothetical protein